MITQEELKLLNELGVTNYGTILKKHLNDTINDLNDVQTCKTLDEMLGRAHGVRLMKQILGFLEPTPPKVSGKTSYD